MINSNTYYSVNKGGKNGGYWTGQKSQNWEIGQSVNVGFLKGLKVLSIKGNEYTLESGKGALYTFIPHNGIKKIETINKGA